MSGTSKNRDPDSDARRLSDAGDLSGPLASPLLQDTPQPTAVVVRKRRTSDDASSVDSTKMPEVKVYGSFHTPCDGDDGQMQLDSCCPVLGRGVADGCSSAFSVAGLKSRLPILKWAPKYSFKKMRSDAIAGFTVGLTVIPQGLAYAAIAGLPLQYGLYSAYMGCFVYMVLGTAKDITLGPTAIMSLMTGEHLMHIADPEEKKQYAVLLTLATGAVQLAMGMLHLGFVIRFISHPVIAGFTSSAAIIIAFNQVKSLLGLKLHAENFMDLLTATFAHIGETKLADLAMGLACCVVLVVLRNCGHKAARMASQPNSSKGLRVFLRYLSIARNALVVCVAAAVASLVDSYFPDELTLTGYIKPGIPIPELPKLAIGEANVATTLGHLGSGLLLIPLICILESLAIGKAFANKNRYRIDSTQEFIALGAANIVSSFFHSFPVTGSFSRTALNSQSGVRTPAGGFFTGSLVIIALLLLSPLFSVVPRSALAAVIICAVLPMFDSHEIKLLWRVRKSDLLPFMATFFGCFLLGIELGIGFGILVCLLMLLYAHARPEVRVAIERQEAIDSKGAPYTILSVRPASALYFPSAEFLQNIVQEAVEEVRARGGSGNGDEDYLDDDGYVPPSLDQSPSGVDFARRVDSTRSKTPANVRVILDCRNLNDLDSSIMRAFKDIVEAIQAMSGCQCAFAHLNSNCAHALVGYGMGSIERCGSLNSLTSPAPTHLSALDGARIASSSGDYGASPLAAESSDQVDEQERANGAGVVNGQSSV